jgi:hypothetical protein
MLCIPSDTALIIAPTFEGRAELFFATFAVGAILTPALNDPVHSRRDEDGSWLGRQLTKLRFQLTGIFFLKLVGVALAWASSLIWSFLWLPALTALAYISIQGRVGALLQRGSDLDERDKDLRELFDGVIPAGFPQTFTPQQIATLRRLSDREISKAFSADLAEKVRKAKRLEEALEWYRLPIVIRRMLVTLAALAAWICTAYVIIAASGMPIDASNYSGAIGLLGGVAVAFLMDVLRG